MQPPDVRDRGRLVPLGTLVRASHPAPTAAVTLLAALLAGAAGYSPAGAGLIALATLTGQISIGLGNDVRDRVLDEQSGRLDKPLVAEPATAVLAWRIAVTALIASVPLSVAAAGWQGGLLNVAAISCGWAYNIGLSRTTFSWLPYGIAFALLPAFVTLGAPLPHWPPLWLMVACAGLGIAAHLANALRDRERDAASGVGGSAVVLGRVRTRIVAAVAVAIAGVAVTTGAMALAPILGALVGVLGAVVLIALVMLVPTRALFSVLMAAALLQAGAVLLLLAAVQPVRA